MIKKNVIAIYGQLIGQRITKIEKMICIGNSMICSDITLAKNTMSDISKLLHVISQAVRRVKFEAILKYHEWYLCQILCKNHAIICLYYYPQKVCNFHM